MAEAEQTNPVPQDLPPVDQAEDKTVPLAIAKSPGDLATDPLDRSMGITENMSGDEILEREENATEGQ